MALTLGPVAGNVLLAIFMTLVNWLFLWAIARSKLNDKTWKTPLKISVISAFIGLIFGAILQSWSTPSIFLLVITGIKEFFSLITLLSAVHLAAFVWLVKYFYKIKTSKAVIFGSLVLILNTIAITFLMYFFALFVVIYAFSGGNVF